MRDSVGTVRTVLLLGGRSEIGLAIVEKAVSRMNGRVGVESEPGNGSRFWIELPVYVPPTLTAKGSRPIKRKTAGKELPSDAQC